MIVKNFLQGKWLKHPLHPILVHYPIGLFVLSLLFDAATIFFGAGNPLVRGAFYTMLAGTVMAVLAAIPGLADWSSIREDHPAKKPANLHLALNLAAVALYAVNLWLRSGRLDDTAAPTLPALMSLVGIGILSVSGYLGGLMVYDDGVGVGRHRREPDLPQKTLEPSGHSRGGFIPVAHANALEEGGSLRAEVEGNVIAIVKSDGNLYAFQEFCTHRFGPMSEGALRDGQIECPWHRSCFSIKTGEVTQGPAKVALKTFEVEERDGQIAVRVP